MRLPVSYGKSAPVSGLPSVQVVLALLLLLLSAGANSDDARRVFRPFVTEGDTWTYRSVRPQGQMNWKVELETITVTNVNEAVDTIHADIDQRPEGTKENREPDRSGTWTSEWNAKILTLPGISKGTIIRPHGAAFRFPMKVGDAYDTSYELSTATKDGPGDVFRISRKTKVTRWEEVSVRAGRFNAIVIESDGKVEQVGTGKTWRMVAISWYSPEVRRSVKYMIKHWPGDIEAELVSFKLSEVQ